MITPIYAALLAFLYIYLCVRVIKLRIRYQVGIGSGNQPELERAIRVQGNFSEYVPFALLLVWMLETVAVSVIWVHCFGLLLLIGRALHAYGVSQVKETLKFRQMGMMSTFAVILLSALMLLGHTLF